MVLTSETKFDVIILVITVLFFLNIVYSLKKMSNRFLFFLFQISIFTFLISRPLIGTLRGEKWWLAAQQAEENVFFALGLIFITEIAMLFGAICCEKKSIRVEGEAGINKNEMTKYLQAVSLVVFIVSTFFYLCKELEPLLVLGRSNYLSYYVEFNSKLPSIVHLIASFMKYSMCIYLATLPQKKRAFLVLGSYVFSTIPSLLVGVRNPFVLSLFFSLTYYLLRDFLEGKNEWVGKIEKKIMILGIPLGIVFLNVYSYIRSGIAVSLKNPLSAIVDFFYGQGVTFEVLTIGYGYETTLRTFPSINYTFGGIVDYIYRGRVGQALFGTEALPAGNNEFTAVFGNSYAHALSFASFPEQYLDGRGRGSSYLAEVFFDFGYIGVILFSFILGFGLIYVVYRFGKNTLESTIILLCLTTIFFAPRAEATGWLTFIVTIQFWLCVFGCYFATYICMKCPFLKKLVEKLKLYS